MTRNFALEPDDSVTPTPGDVSGNGETDLADAVLALRILAGAEISSYINIKADVDGDEEIGLAEVIYILQKAAD